MTCFYKPLALTVNGQAKKYMKNKFNNWYNSQIAKQRDEGVKLNGVNVRLFQSTLKPLHAGWVVELCNHTTSVKGKYIMASG